AEAMYRKTDGIDLPAPEIKNGAEAGGRDLASVAEVATGNLTGIAKGKTLDGLNPDKPSASSESIDTILEQRGLPDTDFLKVSRGTLKGDPELPHPNANSDMVRSLNRQNESADILAHRGLDVTHLPNTGKKG